MKEITYAIASADDATILAEMRILFLVGLLGEQPAEKIDALREALKISFAKLIDDGRYLSVVAKENGTVVATGGLSFREQPGSFKNPSGKVGYIMNMFTMPGYRRQGISTRLINMLMDKGMEKGVTAFELHATKEGEPVYQKEGFLLHGEPTYRRFR